MHRWTYEPASARDLAVIERQIGRVPRGLLGVVRRCEAGYPQVVLTHPTMGWSARKAGEPGVFPTLFWLTCPSLSRACGALENAGMVAEMREKAETDPDFGGRLERAHESYRDERVALIDPESLEVLRTRYPRQYRALTETGIGGLADPHGVKCIHLHLADWLARGTNPVGEEAMGRMGQLGAGAPFCGRGCGSCRELETEALRLSAINVGTNSTKVLVADVRRRAGAELGPEVLGAWEWVGPAFAYDGFIAITVHRGVKMTKLGEGLVATGRLSPEAMERTVRTVEEFVGTARKLGAFHISITCTSASRDASNSGEFAGLIEERTGIVPRIISGEEEARLSYLGAISGVIGASGGPRALARRDGWDAGSEEAVPGGVGPGEAGPEAGLPDPEAGRSQAQEGLVVVDVGGGSTEVVFGPSRAVSIDIGAVRLSEMFLKSDPPTAHEVAAMLDHSRDEATRALGAIVPGTGRLGVAPGAIAVGGTATTAVAVRNGQAGRGDESAHGHWLEREEVLRLLHGMVRLPKDERRRMPGFLEPERADIMPGGLAALLAAMETLGIDRVLVTVTGILEGMVLDAAGCRVDALSLR